MSNEERRKWFIKKAGRRIYRTCLPNSSPADEVVYNMGQIVYNREHAEYLFERENKFRLQGTPVTYFGSKPERDGALLQ